MTQTFTCYTSKGLTSKKEWLLPDRIVFISKFVVPFFVLFIIYDLYQNIQKNLSGFYLGIYVVLFLTSFYLVDIFSAFLHCVFIDSSFMRNGSIHIDDGVMYVNTKYGYSSCHHIFPSNWKDISDTTIITTMIFFWIIPILIIYRFVKNTLLKITLYFFFLISIFMPISHKYSHEKLHGRYVPPIIDDLIEAGVFLSPKRHQTHHLENNYNWALLNGMSDGLFNSIIKGIEKIFGILPVEETVYNARKIKDDIITVKFYGDIEGTLLCSLKDNLFVEPTQQEFS